MIYVREIIRGRLQMDDDNLEADNVRCISPSRWRNGHQFYVLTALRRDRGAMPFSSAIYSIWVTGRCTILRPPRVDRLAPQYLAGQDVVFLTNIATLTERQTNALAEFAGNGGGVVISFGDRMNPEQASRVLEGFRIGTLTELGQCACAAICSGLYWRCRSQASSVLGVLCDRNRRPVETAVP